jgi:midasin
VRSPDFDEAVLPVLISLWRAALAQHGQEDPIAETQLGLVTASFRDNSLSTGVHMDDLWQHLRPPTAPTIDRLNTLLHLESLADQFDEAIFRAKAPLEQLAQVRDTFRSAIRTVVESEADATALIVELEGALMELRKAQAAYVAEPFFREQFETIWLILEFRSFTRRPMPYTSPSPNKSMLSLLARRPTKLASIVSGNSTPKLLLLKLVKSLGTNTPLQGLSQREYLRSLSTKL